MMRENTNYLAHHGVKGQQWGVRRYQNADGSLTEEGRAKLSRYKDKENKRLDKRFSKTNRKYEKKLSKDLSEVKRAKYEYRYNVEKGKQKIERAALKKMTYDQMLGEKYEVRRDRGRALLLGALDVGMIRVSKTYTGLDKYPIDRQYRYLNFPNKNDTLRRARLQRASK